MTPQCKKNNLNSYTGEGTDPYQGQHPQKQLMGFFHQAPVKQAARKPQIWYYSRIS